MSRSFLLKPFICAATTAHLMPTVKGWACFTSRRSPGWTDVAAALILILLLPPQLLLLLLLLILLGSYCSGTNTSQQCFKAPCLGLADAPASPQERQMQLSPARLDLAEHELRHLPSELMQERQSLRLGHCTSGNTQGIDLNLPQRTHSQLLLAEKHVPSV